jgi:predicted NUDIX family NTP pyrophosphohydrolase
MLVAKQSAGLLLYRRRQGEVEVLLVHPGGPFWARQDTGAWSIPKGEYPPGEAALAAARREFQEETGIEVSGAFVPLTPRKQPSSKIIAA